jgi:cholesterol transport system auxiliary component
MRKAGVLASACVSLLAACSSLSSTNAHHYFVLDAAPARAPKSTSMPRPETLIVAPTQSASFYDTQEIVYSRVPGERAYYQYSSWTERPARTIDALLTERLERSAAFRMVASSTSGMRGSLLLRTRLVEMFHEAAASPGQVQVVLAAEVVDPDGRTVYAKKTFSATAPAMSFDAAGAVQAFDGVVGTLVDDVVDWVSAVRPGEH